MAQVMIEVPDEVLWTSVLGSAFETWSWWTMVKYLDDANWDKPGHVHIGIIDPDNEGKEITKVISIEDLARGMAIAIQKGYRDPFGHTDWGSFDFDAITGDIVMQCAVLGECVYS